MTFISIAGNIGSGKSTLARKIAERFGYKLYSESIESPLWTKYYDDLKNEVRPSENAYLLQISYLWDRSHTHLDIQHSGINAVQDRTIYEDREIFARHLHKKGFISDKRHQDYLDLFEMCTKELRQPDLLIFLSVPVEILRRRIRQRLENQDKTSKERGLRERERQLLDPNNPFLADLGRLYFHLANEYGGPKLFVPNTDLDFVDNPNDLEELLIMVRDKLC